MTEKQRQRLVSMVAAYVEVRLDAIEITSITPAGSSRIRLRLPIASGQRIIDGFRKADPRLCAFLEDFKVLAAKDLNEVIRSHQIALTELSRDGSPDEWTKAQMTLASAYLDRLTGNRLQNLDHAIRCAENALTVLSHDRARKGCPNALNVLGLARVGRVRALVAAGRTWLDAVLMSLKALPDLQLTPAAGLRSTPDGSMVYRLPEGSGEADMVSEDSLYEFVRQGDALPEVQSHARYHSLLVLQEQIAVVMYSNFDLQASGIERILVPMGFSGRDVGRVYQCLLLVSERRLPLPGAGETVLADTVTDVLFRGGQVLGCQVVTLNVRNTGEDERT